MLFVLWCLPFVDDVLANRDRRVLADPIGVSVEQILPQFTVVTNVLKRVYQLFNDRLASKATRGGSDVLCYLCGDAATMVSGKHVTLTKVAMKQVRIAAL